MEGYQFIDQDGTFELKEPQGSSYLYFPLAGEQGIKSSITPTLAGDCKADQNHFLLQPVSAEELHNNKSSRNFWCIVREKGCYSLTGAGAVQEGMRAAHAQKEKSKLTAGALWHKLELISDETGLKSEILSFIPVSEHKVEIMSVSITNICKEPRTIVPIAAIPMYGRSADNIRDHRHVTSLLGRIHTVKEGVLLKPTLSFDERGHQRNDYSYYVIGVEEDGMAAESFYPCVEDFIGEGGSFFAPRAVYEDLEGVKAGSDIDGYEALGGIRFRQRTLKPGETAYYHIFLGMGQKEQEYLDIAELYGSKEKVMLALKENESFWKKKNAVRYHTGNPDFDCFMNWVNLQPELRKIYGCSFLPHHDYGRGGRGWRDLWQDCLALIILNPERVKDDLLSHFGGVRMDGTNATIIGDKPGEFKADRNGITRVWMDHGMWPCMTTALYIHQSGDLEFLLKENTYFKDRQIFRGSGTDEEYASAQGQVQKDLNGRDYYGSVLEHLLIQNLTAFYDVGEHNHMRLHGADWNDAIDMAAERGESVAFTAGYAGNLEQLADMIGKLSEKRGMKYVEVAAELQPLFETTYPDYQDPAGKRAVLEEYCNRCRHTVLGQKVYLAVSQVIDSLKEKAEWIRQHIRDTEWVSDGEHFWFNGYYDNSGRQVEGRKNGQVRMMLTSQVFTIMAGTADDEQIREINRTAYRYLYEAGIGGYRLNTDFHEMKTDMGRMFGFAYGHKENGAVFSHMATMFANALYSRGYALEGYLALISLYEQSRNFEVSRIYPGIPEYFNDRGRGMYHYLTGAASWYILTVITQMFGIRGVYGDLQLTPRLTAEQFDPEGRASIRLTFGKRRFEIVYVNQAHLEYGTYAIADVYADGKKTRIGRDGLLFTREEIHRLDDTSVHTVVVELKDKSSVPRN